MRINYIKIITIPRSARRLYIFIIILHLQYQGKKKTAFLLALVLNFRAHWFIIFDAFRWEFAQTSVESSLLLLLLVLLLLLAR